MDGLLFFFKTHGIKCEYIGEFEKIGLKKDNSFANYEIKVDSYFIKCNSNEYVVDFKKIGRPQYFLWSSTLIINAKSQTEFLKKFKELEKVEKVKPNKEKEKIQGTAFRMLRHYLKMNKKQLGQSIGKSELTIMRYEDASLALQSNVMLAVLTVHKLKLKIYIDILQEIIEKTNSKYTVDDFYIITELKNFYTKYKGVEMSDFLTVDDVSAICKIKQAKAYKIIKAINDEMSQKGYIVIRGRVNRKFFNEKLGIQDTKGERT